MMFACECGWQGRLENFEFDPCPRCGSMNIALLEPVDPIRIGWAAKGLGLTICPGKKAPSSVGGADHDRDLAQDLITIAESADVVVNLVPDDELDQINVSLNDYNEIAKHLGLTVQRWPFTDNTVPEDHLGTVRFVRDLVTQLAHGTRVVIHCKGGLGRSGLIAGCAMREAGMTSGATLKALQAARGPLCPSTHDQIEYVRQWPRGL